MTMTTAQLQQDSVPIKATASSAEEISIKLEFGGGLHLLFNSQPKHNVTLPKCVTQDESKAGEDKPVNVKYLIRWMKDNLLSERVEMFGDGDGVRPGILVLINDTDWELEGELDYQIQQGDEIVFISTLHGG
ncbi:Ubiquitin- modifier 1 [Naganishia albida]|nr:Ubiquitin- modifier 1 [Naganishia albida]